MLRKSTTSFFWNSCWSSRKSAPWRLQQLPRHSLHGMCLWGTSLAGPSACSSGQLPFAWPLRSHTGSVLLLRSPSKALFHDWWHPRRSHIPISLWVWIFIYKYTYIYKMIQNYWRTHIIISTYQATEKYDFGQGDSLVSVTLTSFLRVLALAWVKI